LRYSSQTDTHIINQLIKIGKYAEKATIFKILPSFKKRYVPIFKGFLIKISKKTG